MGCRSDEDAIRLHRRCAAVLIFRPDITGVHGSMAPRCHTTAPISKPADIALVDSSDLTASPSPPVDLRVHPDDLPGLTIIQVRDTGGSGRRTTVTFIALVSGRRSITRRIVISRIQIGDRLITGLPGAPSSADTHSDHHIGVSSIPTSTVTGVPGTVTIVVTTATRPIARTRWPRDLDLAPTSWGDRLIEDSIVPIETIIRRIECPLVKTIDMAMNIAQAMKGTVTMVPDLVALMGLLRENAPATIAPTTPPNGPKLAAHARCVVTT
jgi:hypothetical protein